jgi:rRNA maturation endonuclease Nob1
MNIHKINEPEKDRMLRIMNYNFNKYFKLVDSYVWQCRACKKEFDNEDDCILHLEKFRRIK